MLRFPAPSKNIMDHFDASGKAILINTLMVSFVGLVAAVAATRYRKRKNSKLQVTYHHITPQLHRTESGRVAKFEKFSHYVARQIGFTDANEVPQLCKLADEYLIRKSKGCEQNIYEYYVNEPNAESLYVKLIEEFERCILGYFAYHWSQASFLISQVLAVESKQKPKLKEFILAATRKQRFEHITKELKMARVFCTLVKEMKTINSDSIKRTEWVAPDTCHDRNPILLLMGGGMGAGKSTVLKDILKESMWTEAESNPIVVEADAFKETDVIFQALSSRGRHDDMLHTAELVHQSSTDAASSLLVAALNEGRNVIMDGTLSWEPYVEQIIAMARNVHKCKYRMGVGYKVNEDGNIVENYWEQTNEEQEEPNDAGEQYKNSLPYRIELVGVVCDPYLAVVRGIRRALMTGRAVRVNSQLRSHKRFACAFPKYCELVDSGRLFSTNDPGCPPKLIAWLDIEKKLTVDPEEMKLLTMIRTLNAEAESIHDLYDKDSSPLSKPGSVWNDIVLSPSRRDNQKELWESIVKIEKKIAPKQ